MADFFVDDVKKARAVFQAANGQEVPVQGDISWAVTPDGAVTFAVASGPELTNSVTMVLPTNGFVISATADKDLNPDVDAPLTIGSPPHNILSPQAQGGEVVIE